MNRTLSRRKLLSLAGASFSTVLLQACTDSTPESRYNQKDIDQLAAQRKLENSTAGLGPFGGQNYAGYRGLAELPWFELDNAGRLICVDESLPPIIDCHCHLGMSVLFKPELDLQKESERVQHLLDCDATDPGCKLELDKYMNSSFSEEALDTLKDELTAQGLWGSRFASTQTIPNLLREMDDMRIEQAMILPIKMGFWFGDDQTEVWRSAIKKAQAEQRLLAGFSVHPRDSERLPQLREHAAGGHKLMKLHPVVQRFYPDDQNMMEVYELAQELGVTIFIHGGRAGIEQESAQKYAMPRHYEAMLADFPDLQVIIGHAGARDVAAMVDIAVKYENCWIRCAWPKHHLA